MNITNIDDKIINKSIETGKNWKTISEEYEAEFWEDLQSLNVQLPNIKLRVTDKIPEIVNFIKSLDERGFAKRSNDGSVVFNTKLYQNYGKLQNIGGGEDTNTEFALWKKAKPNEPSWETQWTAGRPGWHIECSTLASLVFGNHIDFHAGGIDLRFPHHENEEAQSCAFHGVDDWVTHWIHTGHLHLKDQEKMSKSLKNTISIQDMLSENTCDEFRMACLMTHYRTAMEFSPELMEAARNILQKVKFFHEDANAFINGSKDSVIDENLLISAYQTCHDEIEKALEDDFNTPSLVTSCLKFMGIVSKMLNSPKTHETSKCGTATVQAASNLITDVFTLTGFGSKNLDSSNVQVREENLIKMLIKYRNEIRLLAKESKQKELFKICDAIRDELSENDIVLKDHGKSSSYSLK